MISQPHVLDHHRELADFLLECRDSIIEQFRGAVSAPGGPLNRDPIGLLEYVDWASRIVTSVAEQLGGGPPQRLPAPAEPAASSAGQRRNRPAPGTVAHLLELTHAGSLLLAAVTAHLVQFSEHHPAAAAHVLAVTTVLRSAVLCPGEADIAERQRLSREIHDRLGHHVTAALRNLDLFHIYLPTDRSEAERRVGMAGRLVRDAAHALHNLIKDLRLAGPPANIELALLEYGYSLGGARTHVVTNGDPATLPPRVVDQSFLVLREALCNAVTRGASRNVWITIDITAEELRATVDDDGLGFDPRNSPQDPTGHGLATMSERAMLLGGALRIDSSVGNGTCVELVVPLPG